MKTKSVLVAVILIAAIGGLLLRNHQSPHAVAEQKSAPAPRILLPEKSLVMEPRVVSAPVPAPISIDDYSNHTPPTTEIPKPAIKSDTTAQPVAVDVYRPSDSKPAIQDPVARQALFFVGMDPDAEDYWISAINDTTLPPDERRDLIEDLNEDGISDPHHPGPEDMPLIASRIFLIEQLAPYAADQVNADAFKEAYKDLVNLLNGLPAD